MGARKDLAKSFSRMTREEVDLFCMEWGIGTKFKPVAQACDKSINECPPSSIALYCQHFEFSNLRYPFSNFILNILEYYRVSFGQIHPLGMARVLHFEILCRAIGYDPSLLSFRRFFRLLRMVIGLPSRPLKLILALFRPWFLHLGSGRTGFSGCQKRLFPLNLFGDTQMLF